MIKGNSISAEISLTSLKNMPSGPAAELTQHARAAIMSADVQFSCNC